MEQYFKLRFVPLSEEILSVRCRLIWTYEIPLVNLDGKSAYNLGLEIIGPLKRYADFYNNIAIINLDDRINSISG